MFESLEVLFTPADFGELPGRDLSQTTCVVFDVLRATSSIVTALANGAEAVIPVDDIPEALAWREKLPKVLLAGERQGLRILANQTGGVDFDLGNSPREFTRDKVAGRTIVLTTTNGSRALRACAGADTVLASCLLNLRTTLDCLNGLKVKQILLVCSGTFEQAAYEDVLAAGAMADLLWADVEQKGIADSALMARQIYLRHQGDLAGALALSKNGSRLLANPDLRDDVAWCLRVDALPLVAKMEGERIVRVREA